MSVLIASPPSVGPIGQPITLQGRLVHPNGTGATVADEGNALKQADVSFVDCNVYDLDGATPDLPISTPAADVTDVISDTLIDDEIWTADDIGRNFTHVVAGNTFSAAHRYRVIYDATLMLLGPGTATQTLSWGYEHHVQSLVAAPPYRVSEDEVRGYVSSDPGINMTPFIRWANVMTDQVEACAEGALSAKQLKEIEALLAAHAYSIRDQQYSSKSTERASASFQGQTGMGLDYSAYGQLAKMTDPTGCLAGLSQEKEVSKRASMSWVGKPPSRQIPRYQRD